MQVIASYRAHRGDNLNKINCVKNFANTFLGNSPFSVIIFGIPLSIGLNFQTTDSIAMIFLHSLQSMYTVGSKRKNIKFTSLFTSRRKTEKNKNLWNLPTKAP